MEKASMPFSGSGEEALFQTWKAMLKTRIQKYSVTPLEEIMILKANTGGDALRVVELYHAASAADPPRSLTAIWNQLEARFGTSSKIAASLRKRVSDIKPR